MNLLLKVKNNNQHLVESKQGKAKNLTTICYLLLTIYCLLFTLLSACTAQKEKIYRKSRILMDTFVTITVVSNSEDSADKAIDTAFSEIERLEKLSNFFSSESEVSRINKNAGICGVRVSPDILDMLNKAIMVSEKTEGAFDVTIGPVISLYDFHKKIKPEESAVKKNLSLVNYRELIIDRNKSAAFLKKRGMLIDLGGIAKGYAADKAVETLKRCRINAGLVSVAGDIRTFGLKLDGLPWKIGIRNPRIPLNPPIPPLPRGGKSGVKGGKGGFSDDVMATIELSDMAISTSGDYERCFILDGKRYHHLLSPKTGYPAEGCQSVSVITKECAFTDAFATGIFILGPEKGLKVLEKMGFDGIIVDSHGKVHTTPNIRGKFEFKRTS
jgi:thiamine biosynthesis lipoprotein